MGGRLVSHSDLGCTDLQREMAIEAPPGEGHRGVPSQALGLPGQSQPFVTPPKTSQ